MHVQSPFTARKAAAEPGPSGLGRNLLHILLWAIILPIPFILALTGAWVGSTLAVHHGHAAWLALIGALVVFGVLPYLWERVADRHQVGGRLRDAILRSSFLSTVLIVVLLATHAKTTYEALATRGDWFLASARTPAAESIRRFVFRSAEGFRWLDTWVRDVSYGWADTTGAIDPSNSSVSFGQSLRRVRNDVASALGEEQPLPRHPIEGTGQAWPLPPEIHPHVAKIRATNPDSPEAVGKWLAEHEPDPFQRVVAIHDFVVDRLVYDSQAFADGSYKEPNRQTAKVVFRDRTGVCAGFAAVFEAIARAAGLKAVVVTGLVRLPFVYRRDSAAADMAPGARPIEDAGHAWNAVEVDGRWHLVDTTFDDPFGDGPPKRDYLFPPPEMMLSTHRPNRDRWQLLDPPLPYGDWLRMPDLTISSHHFGIRVLGLDRPIQPRPEFLHIEVENPHERKITVMIDLRAGSASLDEFAAANLAHRTGAVARPTKDVWYRCETPKHDKLATFSCPAPPGAFEVGVMGESPEYPSWQRLASIYYKTE